ncbi:Hsp33 family molecular chaperone HslO [Meiothermus granaticius]|uniref:33 kDa chaperonin n=1 Tax=Meiothermus granaticius NBRC 107808 TaxID=1227551 RepID=A0A399F6X4_9DEIN|nr:Hsp33 family molecular chaperone HslO [Meiothermus granaticius]RIH92414.1 33 kDa chaperonin [Meiothermus granaticius NBRC 107808]GEM87449.1 33 kDa chaperonin [Meiothermus granaticius NBRC 107808]
MGRLIRGLAAEGNLRVLAALTTDVVEEARLRHGLSPTPTAALGRAMTGALLLTFLLSKTPKERITLHFRGDGPLGGPIAEAAPDGLVRGYVKQPHLEPPLRPDGKLNVGAAVGRGELKVDRLLSNQEIYQSSTELISGEIAEDLARYLWQSEQAPSAVLLGVRVYGQGEVQVAGGVAVQVLPGCPDEVVRRLEANLLAHPSLTDLLLERGLEGSVEALMQGLGYQATDLKPVGYREGYIPLQFGCRCTRERALNALVYFSPQERQEMIEQDGGAEVICHWCGDTYRITPDEIRSLRELPEGPRA